MPIKATKRIEAWSYSRYNDWASCPFKAFLKHVEKVKEPDNEYQAKGTIAHKEAEGWSTKKTSVVAEIFKNGQKTKVALDVRKLPESLKLFKKEFDDLRKIARLLHTEEQLGLARDWSPTEWFDSDATKKGLDRPWCRVTMDLRYQMQKAKVPTLKIVDYKTGRVREENLEQSELYAIAGFEVDEAVERVETELWYLDEGVINPPSCDGKPVVFVRADAAKLKKKWEAKVKPMLTDVQFRPTPNDKCRFCHYRKNNKAKGGGQCKF